MGWIIFIVATLGWHIGMYGMFKKAGIEPWKALVPFYNTWCMVTRMPLKKYWFFFQLVPIAGQFVTIWITIKFVEHFGRFGVGHHALTTFIPFIYFPYLGFSKNERYAGESVYRNYKKSSAREWVDAAAFAVVAATLIRGFIFEAYVIPSQSMEKSLLVNDFLFVSKMTYGSRVPMTPIAFPFVHHSLPFTRTQSYSEAIKIPYTRWGAKLAERGDPMVFNFPENDTLINDAAGQYGSAQTYYQVMREEGRQETWNKFESDIITRPVDKREHFIKRCVAIAGDTIAIKNGILYVNGKLSAEIPRSQRYYLLESPATESISEEEVSSWGIALRTEWGDYRQLTSNQVIANITNEEIKSLKLPPTIKKSEYYYPHQGSEFPYYNKDTANRWSADNYGPLWIPAKGAKIQLTPDNIIRYGRCITTYENNKLELKNGKYFLNGVEASTYTFKFDYYWLMGDNRHLSLDSRFWGFVPEDHVVGKAKLIFMSWEGGPRWKRLFNLIK